MASGNGLTARNQLPSGLLVGVKTEEEAETIGEVLGQDIADLIQKEMYPCIQ